MIAIWVYGPLSKWAVRESLMSLKTMSNVSEKKRNRLISRNRWKPREITNKTEEGIYKKTICLVFSRRFSFSSGLVFLWRENNKNGNISLRQIDMTLRDKKKIWKKQNWTQSSLIEEQLNQKKKNWKLKEEYQTKEYWPRNIF